MTAGAAAALAGAGAPKATAEVVQALTAGEGLADALARHGAGALVVGRIARREEARLLRLGRAARRLLRALPSPVVVVPPDFSAAAAVTGETGDGTVDVAAAGDVDRAVDRDGERVTRVAERVRGLADGSVVDAQPTTLTVTGVDAAQRHRQLGALAGLRTGEAFALRWEDVDLAQRKIHSAGR